MKKQTKSIFHQCFYALAVLLITWGCSKTDENPQDMPVAHERGEVISSSSMGSVSLYVIEDMIADAGIEVPLELKYPVEVLSVTYATLGAGGEHIIASGAIFIPLGHDDQPLLSIQHGTETKRNLVASVHPENSVEGMVGLVTASTGYFSLVPDYPGFGVSEEMHPYMHAESLIPSVIDFMRAGKEICESRALSLNGKIFLTGYSEGGYVTLAAQKAIEEKHPGEFDLTAVAPLAGPYDLKGMMDSIFMASIFPSNAYAGYFLTAYNHVYQWTQLNHFFISPYGGMMNGLFDGTKTWGEVTQELPENFQDLMNPEFIQAYNSGNEPALEQALAENTLLDWTPQTPIHFFHGDADSIVPFQNVLTAMAKLTSNGATDIQMTTIPGGTHESSGPAAIFGALKWFEEFNQ